MTQQAKLLPRSLEIAHNHHLRSLVLVRQSEVPLWMVVVNKFLADWPISSCSANVTHCGISSTITWTCLNFFTYHRIADDPVWLGVVLYRLIAWTLACIRWDVIIMAHFSCIKPPLLNRLIHLHNSDQQFIEGICRIWSRQFPTISLFWLSCLCGDLP